MVAALLLKRAADLGADIWRTTRACNLASALLFAPLALLGGTIPSWGLLWQPAVVGLLFVTGQVLTLLALKVGDVSVATPVMGVKIVLVAALVALLVGDPISANIWVAALLSSVAIALLNFTRGHAHQRLGATIVLAVTGAGSFALFDVLVQKWSPAWGAGRFLPVMMVFVAAISPTLRPWRRSGRMGANTSGPSPARGWVMAGACCMALQAIMIVSSIAVYGQAAVANVLYSSRGLWSVVAVWAVGHWFTNREQGHGRRVLGWRLAGAGLLLVAIVLVVWKPA